MTRGARGSRRDGGIGWPEVTRGKRSGPDSRRPNPSDPSTEFPFEFPVADLDQGGPSVGAAVGHVAFDQINGLLLEL